MTPQELVSRILALRDRRPTTSKGLSQLLGVPQKTLESWLSGGKSRNLPSPKSVRNVEPVVLRLEQEDLRPARLALFNPPVPDARTSDGGQSMPTERRIRAANGAVASSRYGDALREYKTITDPIHDDIKLTALETRILDTKDFQRLHGFRQLASAYLVYPGAVHTRFDHSLGTMAQAEAIVSSITLSPDKEEEIGEEATLLIRLAALLHDIPYVPFGHELEDEARVVEKHETRYESFIGGDTEIGQIITRELGADMTRMLLATLSAKTDEEIESLTYPFAADIVGNTVCSDLLDYLKRDNYFTGLKESFGRRFMRYFVVAKLPSGSRRLVVRLEKKGVLRRDVLSEIVHLLRARYTLGERVYFHHAKQVASAMISKAVFLENLHRDPTLPWIGDEELLNRLEGSANPEVSYIAGCLRKRSLFKAVYSVGAYHAKDQQDRLARELYLNPSGRDELERQMASDCGIPEGGVIVYCPDPRMALKQAAVKVRWIDGAIYPLNEIRENPPSGEIKELEDKHRALWRLSVLLRSDVVDSKGQALSDACFHHWGMVNENQRFSAVGPEPSRAALTALAIEEDLRQSEVQALWEAASLSTEETPRSVDGWRARLSQIRSD